MDVEVRARRGNASVAAWRRCATDMVCLKSCQIAGPRSDDKTPGCKLTHVAFPASSRLVIHSVESEHMKGKNDKGIVMMAVELRGRCMDVFFAVWWRCKACITTTLRSTACASLVLRTEACRMTREEYNALARQVANARKTQQQSKQLKAVCEWDMSRRRGTIIEWRGRAFWPVGGACRR